MCFMAVELGLTILEPIIYFLFCADFVFRSPKYSPSYSVANSCAKLKSLRLELLIDYLHIGNKSGQSTVPCGTPHVITMEPFLCFKF